MDYNGKLYGRVGDKLFDTGYTTGEFERKAIKKLLGFTEYIISRNMKKSTKLFTLWWLISSGGSPMTYEEICDEYGKSTRQIRYYMSDLRREGLIIEEWQVGSKPQVKEYKLKKYNGKNK